MQKILLPTDLSVNSLKAFPLAEALAREFSAGIVILYALPSPPASLRLGNVKRLREEARCELDRVRCRHLGSELPVECCLTEGAPDQAICEEARLRDCDLVVMSTHGYSGPLRVLLGSTAERVVRHAPCAVLVVRS